jgi:hypothetical protein
MATFLLELSAHSAAIKIINPAHADPITAIFHVPEDRGFKS